MNIGGLVGPIAGLAGSLCGTYVADTLLKAATPENLTKAGKVAWTVGGALIGCVVGSAAGDYVEKTVDDVQKAIGMIQGKVQEEK